MADVATLEQDVTDITDGLDRVANLIQTLKDQLASQVPVTQEDLDRLDGELKVAAAKVAGLGVDTPKP